MGIANEVNEKLNLIPKIDTGANQTELIAQLRILNDFLYLENYISYNTMEIIKSCGVEDDVAETAYSN